MCLVSVAGLGSYVAEGRRPVDLVVRADAGELSLQSEGEGGDVQDQDVWSIPDLPGVQQLIHQTQATV